MRTIRSTVGMWYGGHKTVMPVDRSSWWNLWQKKIGKSVKNYNTLPLMNLFHSIFFFRYFLWFYHVIKKFKHYGGISKNRKMPPPPTACELCKKTHINLFDPVRNMRVLTKIFAEIQKHCNHGIFWTRSSSASPIQKIKKSQTHRSPRGLGHSLTLEWYCARNSMRGMVRNKAHKIWISDNATTLLRELEEWGAS